MMKIARYCYNILLSFDQLGNSMLAGDPDETISSRLGRIKATYGGRIPWTRPLARVTERALNVIQKNHAERSIEPHRGAQGLRDRPCRCLRGAGLTCQCSMCPTNQPHLRFVPEESAKTP
jgi:hypothetical protein